MIQAVLWDMDGTLLDFLAAEKNAIRACLARHGGYACTDAQIARYSAINTKYWKRLERGELTKPEVLRGRFEEFFGEEGFAVDIDAFNRDYQLALGDTIVFFDRADELLARLKPLCRQYLVTNGTRTAQEKKLARSGIGALVDGVFISDVVGAEKPSAAFFDRVFAEIPEGRAETIIVGDSLTSDIRGGVTAGIRTCFYNPRGMRNDSGIPVTWEIRNLWEVERILQTENGQK